MKMESIWSTFQKSHSDSAEEGEQYNCRQRSGFWSFNQHRETCMWNEGVNICCDLHLRIFPQCFGCSEGVEHWWLFVRHGGKNVFEWGVLVLKVQKGKISSVSLHPAVLILMRFTTGSSIFGISVMKRVYEIRVSFFLSPSVAALFCRALCFHQLEGSFHSTSKPNNPLAQQPPNPLSLFFSQPFIFFFFLSTCTIKEHEKLDWIQALFRIAFCTLVN